MSVLGEARSAGFLGPGPLEPQIRHAEGFGAVARRLVGPLPDHDDEVASGAAGPGAEESEPAAASQAPRVLDLGSGGGLPGLVVATQWPEARLVLLEAQGRRAAFLGWAIGTLGLGGRVSVSHVRAEEFGRDPGGRGCFDLVLARSFGPPAVTAECAAPLLRTGGWLVVSEPPSQGQAQGKGQGRGQSQEQAQEEPQRWPAGALGQLGLRPAERIHAEFEYRVLRQEEPCPERFPRRNGVPAKRPLF